MTVKNFTPKEFKATFVEPTGGEKARVKFAPLYSGGECDIDGFDGPAIADLETLIVEPAPPALVDHNPDMPAGRLENVEIVKNEKGELSVVCDAVIGGTEYSDAVISYFKNGPVDLKPSIGIQRIRWYDIEQIPKGETAHVNGRDFIGPVSIVRNGHLTEGSFVLLAGDPAAKAFLAKFFHKEEKRTMGFNEFLEGKGITPEQFEGLTPEEQEALKTEFVEAGGTFDADITDPDGEGAGGGEGGEGDPGGGGAEDGLKDAIAEAVAEATVELDTAEALDILEEVQAAAEEKFDAECGDGKEKDEDFKARVKKFAAAAARTLAFKAAARKRRETRKMNANFRKANKMKTLTRAIPGGGGANQTGRPRAQDIMTASLAMTCGLDEKYVAKHFKFNDNVMNAAMSRENRNCSLRRLLIDSVNSFQRGYANAGTNLFDVLQDVRTFCRDYSARRRAAGKSFNASIGFSTISATDVLHAIVEAYLENAEAAAPTFYRTITKEVVKTDFNASDTYLATIRGRLSTISETGQIEQATYTTQKISGATDPKGVTFAIPEAVLVNDRLDVFTDLLRQLRDLPEQCVEHDVAETFWKMVDGDIKAADGNDFFSAGHKNLVTGAGSALGYEGLGAATAALDSLTDENGYPISSEGAFIVTNSALFPTAQRLYVSENINVADAIGEKNVYAGMYKAYKWVFLNENLARAKKDDGSTDSAIQTYKASQWFMFRDPARRPAILVNKLNGYTSPQIRQFDSDPSTWGTVYQLIYPYSVTAGWTNGAILMRGA